MLNLLGLVYFRGDKLDKAEEVYRKLIAESPDAHTLHYNLGLICFKLGRLEDAESAFLKALELDAGQPEDPLLPRLDLRAAAALQGRDLPVPPRRRQPDGAAAAGAAGPRRPGADATAPPGASPPAPAPNAPPRRRPDTTPPAARSAPSAADGRRSPEPRRPPAEPLPHGRGRPAAGLCARRRASRRDDTLPPGTDAAGAPAPSRRCAGAGRAPSPAPPGRSPPREVFRGLEKGLMEVDFSGKVFIKQGTIYSYSGNLTFWVKDKRPGRAARRS